MKLGHSDVFFYTYDETQYRRAYGITINCDELYWTDNIKEDLGIFTPFPGVPYFFG